MDSEDFDEILDLAKEFHALCIEHSVPEPISEIVGNMMSKVAKIIEVDSYALKEAESCVLRSVDAVEKFANELNKVRQENEQLRLFISAVKDFPSFQC